MAGTAVSVLVARDKPAGTMSAATAAATMDAGWRNARPSDAIVEMPIADRDERTREVLAASLEETRRFAARANGSRGRSVVADWLWLPEGQAVVEAVPACCPRRLACHVAELASAHNVPVLAVVGRLVGGAESLFDDVVELRPEGPLHATAMTRERTGQVARNHAPSAAHDAPVPSEMSP